MAITCVIMAALNTVSLGFLALTPVQRWAAMGRFNTNFMTERWFILIGIIAIVTLTVLFLVTRLNQVKRERKTVRRLFVEYAEKRGLSERECHVLLDIAANAGLERSEAIFTMSGAFDRGVAKMIEKSFARRQTAGESRQLRAELSFLRQKLGFQKRPPSSAGSPTQSRRLSSRQIPVGKKLHITRRQALDSGDIESTVIENDDMELTVKMTVPLESTAGEVWRVQYYFGASVWEFDTSVISCGGDILVLNHSDRVRFINRRRFLRVSVKRPAFVASFPFAKKFVGNSNDGKENPGVGRDSLNDSADVLEPPKFVPAVVTELGGPGLRIETTLETKVGDRVLLAFALSEERDPDSILARGDNKAIAGKIIEGVGRVRNVKTVENGLSTAVELTDLSDSEVDELICATNVVSVRKVHLESRNIQATASDKDKVEDYVGKLAAVPGV